MLVPPFKSDYLKINLKRLFVFLHVSLMYKSKSNNCSVELIIEK